MSRKRAYCFWQKAKNKMFPAPAGNGIRGWKHNNTPVLYINRELRIVLNFYYVSKQSASNKFKIV